MKNITTEYIISLDDSQYQGFLQEMNVDIVKNDYTTCIYGFIEDVDNDLDRWLFPKKYAHGDETCVVKIGQIGLHAPGYAGLLIKDAVNKRVQHQDIDSGRTNKYPVFCVATNKKGQADTNFRKYITREFTHLKELEGENVGGISKSRIKEYYISWSKNIRNRTSNFVLTNKQKECKSKIVDNYHNGGKHFLIGAKPRFGKNFTILKVAKELGFTNILFVSYIPSVFDSLQDDVEKHIDFVGWKYVNYRTIDNSDIDIYDNITPTVVSTSAQKLNYIDDKNINQFYSTQELNNFRSSLKVFSNDEVDLLVLDEGHFGGHTDNMNNIISSINPKYTIFVTGTDSNFRQDPRFDYTNTFEYDYIDECNDLDIVAQRMPKIRFYTYEMDKRLKDVCKKDFKTDEYITFDKFFATKNKRFIHKESVMYFIKCVFGRRDFFVNGRVSRELNSISPYYNVNIPKDAINHTLAIMPSVASIKAIIKLLKEMNYDDEFEFIDASGSDGCKNISEVKKIIKKAKNIKKKTITFTCKRFCEGVTVPEWHGVFFFNDDKSYNEYIQTLFRCQSYENNKPFCYVFDYNVERCLKIRYDQIYYHRKDNCSKDEMMKVLNDCMPIMYYNADGVVIDNTLLCHKIIEVVHKKSFEDGILNLGYSYINSLKWTFDDNLDDIFKAIKSISSNSDNFVVTDNDLKGGRLYDTIKKIKENENTYTSQKEVDKLIKKCLEVLKSIPNFLFICRKRYNYIRESLTKENKELFEIITNINMCDFIYLLDNGYINVDSLDEMLYKFYKDKEELYDNSMKQLYDSECVELAKKRIDIFNAKWIYEHGEDKDVPFSLINILNM